MSGSITSVMSTALWSTVFGQENIRYRERQKETGLTLGSHAFSLSKILGVGSGKESISRQWLPIVYSWKTPRWKTCCYSSPIATSRKRSPSITEDLTSISSQVGDQPQRL